MLARMRPLAASALAVAAVALTVPSATAAGNAPTAVGGTSLSGAEQVPANSSGAGGQFRYQIRGDQLCYTLAVHGLTDPAMAGHVHQGAMGANGPVVIPLQVENATTFAVHTCTTPSATLLAALAANPSGFYVNVHDATYPGGEIRGQLG